MISKAAKRKYDRKRYLSNPDRAKAQGISWRARNPGRWEAYRKNWNMVKAFGITWAQRCEMLLSQGGRCKICKTDDPGKKDFHVDHDHQTGQIRGLLCGACNTSLGGFRDSPDILRAAIIYLGERP